MLENCRWLLKTSRLSGCHPHTIDERSRINFCLLLIHSLIMCGLYSVAAYYVLGFGKNCGDSNATIGCALQRINRYNRCLYVIVTILLSCLRHKEFERAVIVARKFDSLVINNYPADEGQMMNYRQWFVMLAISLAWISANMLITCVIPLYQLNLYTLVAQIVMRITFSMEIAKFCFIYDALYRRFRRLNGSCCKLSGVTTDIGTSVSINANRFTISNLQRLHSCLTDATNHFTSYYGPQLLCWLAFMLLDIITYIFDILYETKNTVLICISCIILIYLSLQVIFISRICNLTCDEV
ncbi:uncharacterized protein LOC114934755 [Nylanderia fulva]|uniref:uncharacterized protein LOC114934755 n=1 Tax=Nylanderia fulva TaxID=613905 RepID=UPI0010FB7448|nr:uncharacterized protein LOC114934755 [Nylanderia fulva]